MGRGNMQNIAVDCKRKISGRRTRDADAGWWAEDGI
jgi:hypothetical protein